MKNKFMTRLVMCAMFLSGLPFTGMAQRILNLDSCRSLALQNNKQLSVARVKQDMAANTQRAARTKFLPKVDALGGYEYFSKEVSLLNNSQKANLTNLGTNFATGIGGNITSVITDLAQQGIISPQLAQQMGNMAGNMGQTLTQVGNKVGQDIKDAFRTNTHNIWAGSIMLRQPIYMGGAITAANRMADINTELVANELEGVQQATIYSVDNTYWTIVSLRHKLRLALSFRDLIKKLDNDVHKMIDEGVATRSDGLKVDVRLNEAEMTVTKVENGLTLSKMLLCQICGLPADTQIMLPEEEYEHIPLTDVAVNDNDSVAFSNRTELAMLENAIDLSRQATRLVRAAYLPQVALTGGYTISNPNVFNGFERKFAGVWNVGVLVRVPLWNWFEGSYKVRATEAATTIATLEKDEAREKISLQLSQLRFRIKEANKRLETSRSNLASAEENMRCANIGFREGVIPVTDVMAAQTAWQQAMSQQIDAEIEVKLSQVDLLKALGQLTL